MITPVQFNPMLLSYRLIQCYLVVVVSFIFFFKNIKRKKVFSFVGFPNVFCARHKGYVTKHLTFVPDSHLSIYIYLSKATVRLPNV